MNKNILKNLTSRPGIYKMLDQNNKILYIGKALNLRKRVSSYFIKGPGSIKTNKLVEKIRNVDVIITNNEQEALILENSLIKKIRPRYNILLRDDKSYPYTKKEYFSHDGWHPSVLGHKEWSKILYGHLNKKYGIK